MRLYNIDVNLMQFIENLYNKATSAVYLNGGARDWSRITVRVITSFWTEVQLTH